MSISFHENALLTSSFISENQCEINFGLKLMRKLLIINNNNKPINKGQSWYRISLMIDAI